MIDLRVQVAESERLRFAVFTFPDQRGLVLSRSADVFVEAVVHDVQLAADTPGWPHDSFGKIDDLRVWFVETDIQKFQNGLGEPGNVLCGARHQLVEGGDAVGVHEFGEARAFEIILIGFPDDGCGEGFAIRHGGEVGN